MRSICVVVIGHVDHGKTSLVRALTGTETDQLDEEKRRGLSILPGYACCRYPAGIVDLVDAPGHADFVRAMVMGASGARAALIVVSAVEGVCAQTVEHLQIVEALGINRAVVAVTKADLLERDQDPLAEVRRDLAASSFAGAPVVVTSALAGTGMAELNAALADLLVEEDTVDAPGAAFLPVDRAFAVTGRGTVVTGTLLGAGLALEDALVVQPQGHVVSVRGLQVRREDRVEARAGERTAVQLRGISAGDIGRGAVLCAAGTAGPARQMDVEISVLRDAPVTVKHMQQVRVHVGTGSAVATVRLLQKGKAALLPGGTGIAQLMFEHEMVGYAGQRGVQRGLSPAQTLGGIVILDPQAPYAKGRDPARAEVLAAAVAQDPERIAQALVALGRGAASVAQLAGLARAQGTEGAGALGAAFIPLGDGLYTTGDAAEACASELTDRLSQYHAAHPLKPAAPRGALGLTDWPEALVRHVEDRLVQDGITTRQAGFVALGTHDPHQHLTDKQRVLMGEMAEGLREAGLDPPPLGTLAPTEQGQDLLALLISDGQVMALENVALKQRLVFHVTALETALRDLARAFPPPTPFKTGAARAALGTSRKVIVPVLEHFDTQGLTVRSGDLRRLRDSV